MDKNVWDTFLSERSEVGESLKPLDYSDVNNRWYIHTNVHIFLEEWLSG